MFRFGDLKPGLVRVGLFGAENIDARKWVEYIFDTYWFERVETMEVNTYMVLIVLVRLLILVIESAPVMSICP